MKIQLTEKGEISFIISINFQRALLELIRPNFLYATQYFILMARNAIPHLDLLLEIPTLGGIQWQPGDGNRPMTKWVSLIKRIQQAGKLVYIDIAPQELETILAEVSPKGLMIITSASSEEEAKELIKKAEKFTR